MAPCRCSNCDPIGAIELICDLKTTNQANFHGLLDRATVGTELPTTSFLTQLPIVKSKPKEKTGRPLLCPDTDRIRISLPMITLANSLISDFDSLFYQHHNHKSELIPSNLFDENHA